jgi:sulfate/thiosulfate transport system permease protein
MGGTTRGGCLMSEPANKRVSTSIGRAASDPAWIRVTLIVLALSFLAFVLVMPVVLVFAEAFRDGAGAFFAAISSDDTLSAIGLTAMAVAIAVPVNVVIGVATAWAVGRFRFPGRSLLITLFDVPLAVSPVIAGMTFILLFGSKGLFGPAVASWGLEVVFSPPGIVLATIFVTFPFVARELIPFWESQGKEEEEAALVLGASAWTMFRRVSLPNARWALLYGIVLTTARAMGEFGAVSVVSGHIRGKTNTLPLHVEVLYGDYRFSAAFAVASLLVLSGLVTLVLRKLIEARAHSD